MSVPSAPNIYIRPRALIDSVFLYWRPSTDLGGSAIINYTVTCTEASYSQSFPASVNRITVSSLSTGIDYNFKITATNSTGTGPAANYRTVQVGHLPAGAQNVNAQSVTNTSALVSWNFSTNAGEAPTKWFVLSAIPSIVGAAPIVKHSAHGYELQRELFNLTNGITYKILVQAVNDVGYAPATALSYVTIGAAGFSPLELPGLLFWGDMSTLTGSAVTSIPNLGNYNNPNVTLTGSGTVTQNGLNGKSVLSLNTSQSFTGSSLNLPNWTLFTVARKNTLDGRVFTDGGNNVYGYWGNSKATFSLQEEGVLIPFWTGPPAIQNDTPSWDIQTLTKWNDANGLNVQYNWNGTPLLQGTSATYTNKDTLLSNVSINTSGGEQSASDIAEILIFESALSQEEIQIVEGYLAAKWGLQANLPTSHPYKSQAPSSTTHIYWNPTLLSGCQLWLDAADKTSVQTTGSDITQWNDKSGNANHAAATNDPQYQNSSVVFNGTNSFFTTPYTATPLVETIFVVLKSSDYSIERDIISGVNGGNREFYISGNLVRLGPYEGGTTLSSNTTLIDNNTYLIELTFNSSSASAFTYASPAGTLAGNFSYTGSGTTQIGGASSYFNGSVNEIVIYNRQLNQEERQITEGYLSWKWGLQGYLPLSHPFYQAAPTPVEPVTFNPLAVQGCQLWLDAADQTSITLSGQNVTQIQDKSGNTNNGTPSGTVTYINKTIDTTNGFINTPFTASPTTETVFVVVNLPPGQVQPIFESTVSGGHQLYGYNGRMNLSSVNINTFISGTNTLPSNTPTLYDYSFSSSQIVEYLNGTVDNSVTGSYSFSGDGTTKIGGPLVSEIIFFNRVLTIGERQAIEGYLAWKWNIQASLPSSHPFYSQPPTPNQPTSWSPSNITTLSLWLDGKDINGSIASGTPVTTWLDKSPNQYNATQPTLANAPTAAAGGGVTFDAANVNIMYFNNNVPIQPTTTCFFVTSPSSTSGAYLYGSGNNSGIILNYSTQFNQFICASDDGTFIVTGANPISLYNYTRVQNTSNVGYYMGNQVFNYNPVTTYPTALMTTLACSGGPINLYGGTIYEMIFYNKALSDTERQVVEGYLAHKWNIQTSLPTNHPFYSQAPTPNQPTSWQPTALPGLNLWIDSTDQSSVVPSNGKVLNVIDKSGKNNNMTNKIGIIGIDTTKFSGQPAMSLSNTYFTGSIRPSITSTQFTSFAVGTLNANSPIWALLLSLGANQTNSFDSPDYAYALVRNNGDLGFATDRNSNFVSTVISGYDSPFLLYSSQQPNNGYIGVNGQLIPNTAPTGISSAFNISEYSIGTQNNTSDGNGYYTGTVAEIILTNTTLSQNQRQIVEGYLAWKWGLQSTLPALHPFKSSPPTTNEQQYFSPTNITGLQSWYDASDKTTLKLSGSNITEWGDKSGNENDMIAQIPATYLSEGLGTVNFNSSWYRAKIANAPYPVDVYLVMKLNSLISHVDVCGLSQNNSDNFNSLTFSEYTTSRWHNGSSGFSRTPNAVSSSNETSTDFLLMQWSIADNNFYIYRNGVQIVQTSSYTWTPGTLYFQLGNRRENDAGALLVGQIAEVIVYNSQLNTTNRQAIEGYLAWKWSIQSLLPSSHPYYTSSPPVGLTFPINQLVLSANSIDNGSNPQTVTVNGNVTYTTVQNKFSAHFDNSTSSYLSLPFTATNQFTITYWFNVADTGYYNPWSLSNAATGGSYGCNPDLSNGTQNVYLTFSGGIVNAGGFAYSPQTWYHVALTVNQTTGICKTYLNGELQNTVTGSGTLQNTNYLLLGKAGDNGRGYNGNLSQFSVYNTVLSESIIYWNYQNIVPVPNPDVLLLLLKANTYSGSGAWLDESGNGKNANLVNGTKAKNTQGNGIVLNGSTNWVFPDVGAGSKWTISVWYKETAPRISGNPCILTQQYSSGQLNLFMGYGAGSSNLTGGFLNSNWYIGGAITLATGQWTNIQVTWDGTNMKTYINGVLSSNVQPGGTSLNSSQNGYYIGSGWGNADFVTGEIGELRIYNYVLTQSQVTTDYLSSYNTFFFQPTQIPGNQLWFDGADQSTLTLSGSTVTQWADKSGNGYNTTSVVGTPTYNTSNGLIFNGSSYFNLPNSCIPYGNSSYSIYVVAKFSDLSSSPLRGLFGGGGSGFYSSLNACNFTGDTIITYTGGDDIISTGTVSANTTFMYGTLFQTGSTQTLFLNGTSSGSRTPTNVRIQPNTGNVLGSTVQGQNMYGSISEFLVYNTNHTTQQRQIIEGYLSWKWSLQDNLPNNHPYYANPPPVNVFGPKILLKATNYSGTGTWLDESGNGRNATLENGTVAMNQQGNGIVLDGSTNWTFPNVQVSNSWTLSAWYKNTGTTVGNPASIITQIYDSPTYSIIQLGNGDSGTPGTMCGGFFKNGTEWYRGTAIFLENRQWTNIQVTWDGTTIYTYINGAILGTATPSATSYDGGLAWRIGRRWDSPGFLVGEIGEVRIYGYPLTEAQIQADYQASYNTFMYNPTLISGTQLWLDGADQTTVTLSGTNVTQWNDKSGNSNNATSSQGLTTYTPSEGLNFNGSSYFNLPNGTLPYIDTSYSIYCIASFGDYVSSYGIIGGGQIGTSHCLGIQSDNTAHTIRTEWYANYINSTDAFTSGTVFLFSTQYVSGGNRTVFLSGTASGSDTPTPGRNQPNTGNLLGKAFTANNLKGTISEVLVYNSNHTTLQRQVIEGYLAWKWQTQSQLPDNHPYSYSPPQGNPLGPKVLLKGQHYSGSGNWNDESGNGNNAALEQGTIQVNSANNGIVLNGSTSWTFPNVAVGSQWTANVWFKQTGSSVYNVGSYPFAYLLTQIYNNSTSMNLTIGETDLASTFSGGFLKGSAWFRGDNITLQQNKWTNIQITYDGTTMITYIDGSLLGSVTLSEVSLDTGGAYLIGRRWDGLSFIVGQIGEVRIYNYVLTQGDVTTAYNSSYPTFYAPLVLLKAINYSGSGSWLDESGHNKNATLETGSISKNNQGNGIVLNGSSSWTFPNVSVGNSWSFSVWYKNTMSTAGITSSSGILNQIYSPSPVNISFGDPLGGAFVGFFNGGWYTGASISAYLTPNTWVNTIGTWNGTTLTVYINGSQVQSSVPGGTSTDGGSAYRIGRRYDNDAFVTGEIGEVRIYDYALTQSQVTIDYNASYTTFYPPPLVLLKAINYSGSGTWLDESGHNKNANLESGSIAKNTKGNGIVLNGSTSWTFPNVGVGNSWTANIWYRQTGEATGANANIIADILTQNYSPGMGAYINLMIGRQYSGDYKGGFALQGQGNAIPFVNNKWINIQITWDGTTFSTYIDGLLLGSSQPGGVSRDGGLAYRIGGCFDLPSNIFVVGEIGEVRIYGYPLTQAEVTRDYNESQQTFLQPPIALLKGINYSGSGSWLDQSGNSKNATLVDGAIAKNSEDNAIVLNGSSYWSMPNLQLGNAWTVTAWYKDNNTPSYQNQACIITQAYQSGQSINAFMGFIADGTLSAGFYNPGDSFHSSPYITLEQSMTQYTMTWNGSNLLFYKNAVLQSTTVSSYASNDSGSPYYIGKQWGVPVFMVGEIGEIRAYDYPINQAKVTADYNESLATFS